MNAVDPERLAATARALASIADREGVHLALVGGMAMQCYGSPRPTSGVDVVASAPVDGLPSGRLLAFGGFVVHLSGVAVSVIVRHDEYAPLYVEAREHARAIEVAPIPVVPPEHLAAMKLAGGRPRDTADLEWLLASGPLDVHKALGIVSTHLGPDAVERFEKMSGMPRAKA
jgi:hypothetical protein